MPKRPFAEIEHPADLALQVEGDDLPSLFIHAAEGVFFLMRYPPAANTASPVSYEITLSAPDLETLLVDWLNELLYLAERDLAHLEHLQIHELKDNSLRATVRGHAPCRPARSIKAATYADLAIRRTSAGYETIVTLDV